MTVGDTIPSFSLFPSVLWFIGDQLLKYFFPISPLSSATCRRRDVVCSPVLGAEGEAMVDGVTKQARDGWTTGQRLYYLPVNNKPKLY